MAFDVQPVSASALVTRALVIVEPIARGNGVTITAAPSPEVVALADAAKATQMLVNLLTNAAKFSGRGANVRLSCRLDGDAVRFDVVDSGPGIPPDRLATIFDPWVQLAQRVPKGLEGFGLGLAISREFAQGMGGVLSVSSTPGLGTTFTLRLPALRASGAPSRTTESTRKGRGRRRGPGGLRTLTDAAGPSQTPHSVS